MKTYPIKNIVLVDKENKNFLYVNNAIKLALRNHPDNSLIEAIHIKNAEDLIDPSAHLVFISTNWIIDNDAKWFYLYFERNSKIKFVILINHDSQINELLKVLKILPLESVICFIPIDNYSPTTIVQSMENYIISIY